MVDLADHDAHIVDIERQIAALKGDLASTAAQYREAATQWLPVAIDQLVKATVQDRSAAISEIPDERLTQLKAEIADLKSKSSVLVEEALGDDQASVWRHAQDPKSLPNIDAYKDDWYLPDYRQVKTQNVRGLASAVGSTLKGLGKLFMEYGIVDNASDGVWYHSRSDGGLCFRSGLADSAAMTRAQERYHDLYTQLRDIATELLKARHDRTQAEAKGRWEEA